VSFAGETICCVSALPCAIEWHQGFRLRVETLHQHHDDRGPEFVELGRAVAKDGVITAREIGDAARVARYDLQALKRVWHYVARFGADDEQPRR
jgi:hypothetical protein